MCARKKTPKSGDISGSFCWDEALINCRLSKRGLNGAENKSNQLINAFHSVQWETLALWSSSVDMEMCLERSLPHFPFLHLVSFSITRLTSSLKTNWRTFFLFDVKLLAKSFCWALLGLYVYVTTCKPRSTNEYRLFSREDQVCSVLWGKAGRQTLCM